MTKQNVYKITAIVATALFLSGFAVIGGNSVKADQCWKRGDDVNGQPGWYNCSTTHKSTIEPVSACCSWSSQGYSCLKFCDDYGFNGHIQLQPISVGVEPTNCFWSFPVQCHNE